MVSRNLCYKQACKWTTCATKSIRFFANFGPDEFKANVPTEQISCMLGCFLDIVYSEKALFQYRKLVTCMQNKLKKNY